MTIENQNFDLKSQPKKPNLSDRNSLLRTTPKPKYITHDMVVKFINDSVTDEIIKEKLIIKLKKCPDGALQNFIDNLEKKIFDVIKEMSPKQEKNNLLDKEEKITIDDMVALRNSLSEQSAREYQDESS
jgi:hypothetical protein